MSAPFPSVGEMVDSILTTYRASSEEQRRDGRAWYPTALEVCTGIAADRVPVSRVAAVVSALSPRCSWRLNLIWAHRVIEAYAAGDREVPAVSTRANRAKAWAAVRGDSFRWGPKTASFVANIEGDEQAVTVDVWAARAAIGEERGRRGLTLAQYGRIVDAYRAAAAIVGETPRDLQAIAWIVLRGGGD